MAGSALFLAGILDGIRRTSSLALLVLCFWGSLANVLFIIVAQSLPSSDGLAFAMYLRIFDSCFPNSLAIPRLEHLKPINTFSFSPRCCGLRSLQLVRRTFKASRTSGLVMAR